MSLFPNLPTGVWHLRGVARAPEILAAVESVVAVAPFRQMMTPRGPMSVTMTNCGRLGWVSDAKGYRYDAHDPLTGAPWPSLPATLRELAITCAARAGFAAFAPDACLVNQYLPGTQMGLHQDRNERDFTHPIVSVSLGLSAVFIVGGLTRNEPKVELTVEHGDVVVFGGPSRRMYHGVKKVGRGLHATLGERRLNLTFRKAG